MSAVEFPGAAFAVVAGFAAIIAAIVAAGAAPRARSLLRLGAALLGALAAANLAAAIDSEAERVAGAVTLLAAALGPAVLAEAAYAQQGREPRGPLAAFALAFACLAGLAAAALGSLLLAVAPLLGSVAALGLLAARLWARARKTAVLIALGAFGFVAAAAAAAGSAATGFLLFYAAAGLGVTLALARRSDLALEEAARRAARGPFFVGGED